VRWQRLYNPLVASLLCSPLHALISGSVLLLTFQGRGSGRTYTTPVNYVRDGEDLLLVAARDHTWWKNLRGGAPVKLRIRGRDVEGVAEAYEGPAAEEALLAVLRSVPAYRRHWDVHLGPDGSPVNPEDLSRVASVAKENVPVRVKIPRGQ